MSITPKCINIRRYDSLILSAYNSKINTIILLLLNILVLGFLSQNNLKNLPLNIDSLY